MASPLKVFLSYSHKDKEIKDALHAHLAMLERMSRIVLWDDGEIQAGADWERSIVDHLLTADLVLLLISSDFIASDYCYTEEMLRAGQRHAIGGTVIVPIIGRHCTWQELPVIEQYHIQAIPRNGKPVFAVGDDGRGHVSDRMLTEVAVELGKLVDSIQSGINDTRPSRFASEPPAQPTIPALVADLCDRSPQDEVFDQTLRASFRADAARRPFVFTMHGNDEERHHGLLSRLKEVRVSRLLKQEVELVELENPQLAYVRDPRAAFMAELGNQLLDDRGATMEQLVDYVTGHKPTLLLTSLFDESRDGPDRVRELVPAMMSFWNEWPDLGPDKTLLHCISIRFDLPDENSRVVRSGRKSVRVFLNQLWDRDTGFKECSRVGGAVLPELQSVHRADVRNWAGKREVRRFSDILPEDVDALFEREMPGKPDGLIPMERLHKAIHKLAIERRK